jgi:hypothetical protein
MSPSAIVAVLGLQMFTVGLILYLGARFIPVLRDEVEEMHVAMSFVMLTGVIAIGQWLWRLPFQIDNGAEVVGVLVYGGVPVVVVACLERFETAIVNLRSID